MSGGDINTDSIGGLFSQLANDSSDLIRAEVELYRASALNRIDLLKPGFLALVAAALLAQAALVCLLVLTAIALSQRIGSLGAGFAVAGVALAGAALLARIGQKKLAEATAEDDV